MLTTNQHLGKLSAACLDFTTHNMLDLSLLLSSLEAPMRDNELEDNDDPVVDRERVFGEVLLVKSPSEFTNRIVLDTSALMSFLAHKIPRQIEDLATFIGIPTLPTLLQQFLFEQLSDGELDSMAVPLEDCPLAPEHVYEYPSAVATFYAPSDLFGAGGMHRE